jgi:hypothetical protein
MCGIVCDYIQQQPSTLKMGRQKEVALRKKETQKEKVLGRNL